MVSAKINSHNVDQVTLNFITKGSSTASLMSRETPLSNALDYTFCCDNLTVPMSGLPIFPKGTNEALLNIKKRVTGVALVNLPNTEFNNVLTVSDAKLFFDTSSFIAEIALWANKFSVRRIAGGMNTADYDGPTIPAGANIDLLSVGIDATGRLRFKGSSDFWNRFVIQPTEYGKKLFNLDGVTNDSYISVTTVAGGLLLNGLNNAGNAVVGGNNATTTVGGSLPIYNNIDHRHELIVETFLSIPNQVEIRDNIQLSDRTVVRVPFLNEARATLSVVGGRLDGNLDLQTKSYVGRYPFVKKTDSNKNWLSLNTSYELRYFVFQLLCSYRYFDIATSTFKLRKESVPIDTNDFWELGLRFVSLI